VFECLRKGEGGGGGGSAAGGFRKVPERLTTVPLTVKRRLDAGRKKKREGKKFDRPQKEGEKTYGGTFSPPRQNPGLVFGYVQGCQAGGNLFSGNESRR